MKRILQFVVAGTILGAALSAFTIWIVNWFPIEGSEQATNNFPLFIAITYVSFIIFGVVIVAMAYSLWKFRQRGPSDLRDGDPTHGNTLLEIVWTLIPLAIVVVFGFWGAIVLEDNEASAKGTREITAVAYSFNFEYRYDSDGGFTRNDGLYVPVDEPFVLHLITPLYTPGTKKVEVIHGFWVPEWGVKQDATPGVAGKRVGTTWVTPTREGDYEVQCTELCGSGHGEMSFRNIHVLSKAEFAEWLATAKQEAADAKQTASANPGLAVFNDAGCGGCHDFTPAKIGGNAGPVAGRRQCELHAREGGGQDEGHGRRGLHQGVDRRPERVRREGLRARRHARRVRLQPERPSSSMTWSDTWRREARDERRHHSCQLARLVLRRPGRRRRQHPHAPWLVARADLDDHLRGHRGRDPVARARRSRLAVVPVPGRLDLPHDHRAARLPRRHRLLRLLGAATSSARSCPRATPTTAPTAGATTSRSTPTTR